MNQHLCWREVLLLMGLLAVPSTAQGKKPESLESVNARLHGRVIDHTTNHGADRRIWSTALCQRRDLYVYLPPCFDPKQQYPLVLYLHGFTQDERTFLEKQIQLFDRAIASGQMAPSIIAWPDGSLRGEPSFKESASFFANTRAGRFEDFVVADVYPFVLGNYPIRPEREAHVICGASMGGAAAFTIAFKYPELFKIIVGFMPALNLRWQDCRGRALGNFDPCCWNWRTQARPNEVIGRFFGVLAIRSKVISDPLFGRGPQVIEEMSRINPIELLDVYDVQPGLFDMYVAYGGRDEFNTDAQTESFLYCARQRGLEVGVGYEPRGKHNLKTGIKLFDPAMDWLWPLLAPYDTRWPEADTPDSSQRFGFLPPRAGPRLIESLGQP